MGFGPDGLGASGKKQKKCRKKLTGILNRKIGGARL